MAWVAGLGVTHQWHPEVELGTRAISSCRRLRLPRAEIALAQFSSVAAVALRDRDDLVRRRQTMPGNRHQALKPHRTLQKLSNIWTCQLSGRVDLHLIIAKLSRAVGPANLVRIAGNSNQRSLQRVVRVSVCIIRNGGAGCVAPGIRRKYCVGISAVAFRDYLEKHGESVYKKLYRV